MAPPSSQKRVFFFLACLLMFTFSDNNLVAGDSDKVKLNLYYESLCPSCQDFIVDDLVKIFATDLHTITDLKFVPFGNAKISGDSTVTCQHGEEECKPNAIEACAINTWPDQETHYSFIRCVEQETENWETCVDSISADSTSAKAINDCYNSDLSKNLILGYANQTMSLKPQHEYVPWVTLNEKPLNEDFGDFVAKICKAYKGKTALPKVCNSSALSKKKVSKFQVSYANEAIN
ncbi:hypothetical protein AALP_AAs46213U000200 [Arabis alpina]|uniref:Gamma-interferon-inducible lysosomal thiol reductase n=1 Tax=Arabis alpina TaxID=50452 RepID=A0A087G0T0_ARAAL|nr:hypothetical protein AALP_AAs46213U000200 [Arabis alpina]